MEFRRQEEQLDWVEQTQKKQDASFAPARISGHSTNQATNTLFTPRSPSVQLGTTRIGKTRVPDILVKSREEDA